MFPCNVCNVCSNLCKNTKKISCSSTCESIKFYKTTIFNSKKTKKIFIIYLKTILKHYIQNNPYSEKIVHHNFNKNISSINKFYINTLIKIYLDVKLADRPVDNNAMNKFIGNIDEVNYKYNEDIINIKFNGSMWVVDNDSEKYFTKNKYFFTKYDFLILKDMIVVDGAKEKTKNNNIIHI